MEGEEVQTVYGPVVKLCCEKAKKKAVVAGGESASKGQLSQLDQAPTCLCRTWQMEPSLGGRGKQSLRS